MNTVVQMRGNTAYEDIYRYLTDVGHNSENTRDRYKASIELFFNWHVEKPLQFVGVNDINSITYSQMLNFRNYLVNDLKRAHTTVNNIMSALYSLFSELRKIDDESGKPIYTIEMERIRLNRLNESDKQSYGDIEWEESERMIEYCRSMHPRKMPKVKAALIDMARMTGIRLSGLLNLRYKNLRHEYNMWVIHHSIKGKPHMQAIPDNLAESLFELRKDIDDDNEKIFKISSKTVERMMEELMEELNFDDNRQITFHSIRRLYGREAYEESGNDLELTQKFLGHSNPETTMGYINRELDIQKSPALYIGKKLDNSVVDHMDGNDWMKIFDNLSRGTKYEIINKMKELGLDK